jgi:hypothetical protein
LFRAVEPVLVSGIVALVTSCGGDGGNVEPGAAGTTTTITLDDPDPSAPGQSVEVTVGVTSDAGTPTGDVTVSVVGGTQSCSGAVNNGTMTCSLALTSEGSQTLTATYAGNSSFLPSSDTEPHTVTAPSGDLGQVQITTTTTGSDLDADGYQFTVDGGPSQTIDVNATISIPGLTPGTHTVELSGVAGNCTVAGGTSRDVAVSGGAAATVTFDVTCSPLPPEVGSVRITTNTTGTDLDANGYQVSIDGGQSQSIGTKATSTIGGIAAGPHTVELSDVAANCTVADGSSRNVSVAPGVAAIVNFNVTCTAVPPSTGSIRVSAATSGSALDPDGYRFAVDGGNSRPLGVNGSQTIGGVSAGSHTVVLSNVASNCDVDGGASKSVSVTAGQTAEASFSLTCTATGPSAARSTVVANPTTIATGGTSTVTVTVKDAGGAAVANVNVLPSSSGTGNQFTPVSATTNQNGVATFSFSSTVAGSKTIRAKAGDITLNDTEVISVAARSSSIEITGDQDDPSVAGETITVSWTVTVDGPGIPTGTVDIFSLEEANVGCSVPVSDGQCTFALNTVGLQHLQANYSGDSQFQESSDEDGETHTVTAAASANR